jgi:peptidoglycan/LPS O-acetylase OafA/YrhL
MTNSPNATLREGEPAEGASYPAVTRLDTLDLLRGLCALAVAVFHYHSWGGLSVPVAAEGFLALCGTYGVSIFFVLSGFSLSHAYRDRFQEEIRASTALRYARRRIGRLAPLFGAVVIASVAGRLATGGDVPGPLEVVANLLLIFGLVDPAATPVVGGWSIGVEVVFYVLFPLLLLFRAKWAVILSAGAFMTLWLSLKIATHVTLAEAWAEYVNPANHLLFFAGGVYAALYAQRAGRPGWLNPGLATALVLVGMVLASYQASDLDVVTSWRRVALVLLSILLVWALSYVQLGRFKIVGSLMGGASYPLYLIHPLLFFLAANWVRGSTLLTSLVLLLSVAGAIVCDYLIDKPLQRRVKAVGW